MDLDLDVLEAAARAAKRELPRHVLQTGKQRPAQSDTAVLWDAVYTDLGALVAYVNTGEDTAEFWRACSPVVVLAIIARLRAAEAALRAIHEFANDDGNWEHEEIIADDGMFVGCDGRYTVEAMASDALKGMSDAVPNV